MNEREVKPDGRRAEAAPDAGEQREPVAPSRDPRAAKWDAIVKAATHWNAAHADLVAEFNRLTGGKCGGSNAGVSVRAVRQWQMEHGLTPDGKVGPNTLAAASNDVTFTDEEAGTIDQGTGGANLAHDAVAGAEVEEVEPKSVDEKFEGDTMASDGGQRIGEDIGSDVAGGEVSGGAKAGIGAAARLALVPHIVALLKRHDFKGALHVIWSSVGWEDRAELLKAVAERIGRELGETAMEWFERAAWAGSMADVLLLGWEWTKGGLLAMKEAREKGDQRARINCYAYSWSQMVMTGQLDMGGAVTPQEREAASRGAEDGATTVAKQPELPFLLKAQYGNEHAARLALEQKLLRKAGVL